MSREPLVDSLKALGFTLGKYSRPFGEVDPTKAATYTVFAEATDAEAEAALGSLAGDAAELRAAVKAWTEALDAESRAQSAAYAAAQREQGYEANYDAWRAAQDRLGEAEERLYALAASEGQP